MWLFVVCSSICLVITVLGVYGAISIDTIRKQKEVAIRKINGARLPDIYWLFAKNYLVLFLIASVIGGLISLFVMVIGSQHRVILFDYADSMALDGSPHAINRHNNSYNQLADILYCTD